MVMQLPAAARTLAVLILLGLASLSTQQDDTAETSDGLPPPFFPLRREPVDCKNDVIIFNATGLGDDVTRATCVKQRYAVDFCCPPDSCEQRKDCPSGVIVQDSFALALNSCWLQHLCEYRTCSSFQPRCMPLRNVLDFTSERTISESTSVLRLTQPKAAWRPQSYACGIRSVFGWSVPVRTVLIRRDEGGTKDGEKKECARVSVPQSDVRLECDVDYVTVTMQTPFNITVDVTGLKAYDVDVSALLLSDRGDVGVTCFGVVSTIATTTTVTPDPGSTQRLAPTTTAKTGGGAIPPLPTSRPPTSDVSTVTPTPTGQDKGDKRGEKDEQSPVDTLPIFIVIAVVFFIALILAAIIVCVLRRKGVLCQSKGNNSGGTGMTSARESSLRLQPTSSQPQESIYYSVDGDLSYADRPTALGTIPNTQGRTGGPMYFRLRTDDPTPPAPLESDSAYFTVEPDRSSTNSSAIPTASTAFRRTPNVVQPGVKGPYAVTQLPRDSASFHGDLGSGFQPRVPGFNSLGRPGGPRSFVPIDIDPHPPDPPLPCRGPLEYPSCPFSEDPLYHSIRDSDVMDSLPSAPSPFDRHGAFHRPGAYDRPGVYDRQGTYDRHSGLHRPADYARETSFNGSLNHDRCDGGRQDYERLGDYDRGLNRDRHSTFGKHVGNTRLGDYDRRTSFERQTSFERPKEQDREVNGTRASTEAKPSGFHEGDRAFGNGSFSQAVRNPAVYEPQVPRQNSSSPPPVPADRRDFSVKYKRGR